MSGDLLKMIKNYRESKGYTQEQMAELLDLSPRQVQRIENNQSIPKLSTFKKIVILLEISDIDIARYVKEIKIKDEKKVRI